MEPEVSSGFMTTPELLQGPRRRRRAPPRAPLLPIQPDGGGPVGYWSFFPSPRGGGESHRPP